MIIEIINVGIIVYIMFSICLKRFMLLILVVKFVVLDNGEMLFFKKVFEIIVLVVIVLLNLRICLIFRKVIFIVEIVVKEFFIVILISV